MPLTARASAPTSESLPSTPWKVAQYTYEAAVQSFELSFRTAFNAVTDQQQILKASQTALGAAAGYIRIHGTQVPAGKHFQERAAGRQG